MKSFLDVSDRTKQLLEASHHDFNGSAFLKKLDFFDAEQAAVCKAFDKDDDDETLYNADGSRDMNEFLVPTFKNDKEATVKKALSICTTPLKETRRNMMMKMRSRSSRSFFSYEDSADSLYLQDSDEEGSLAEMRGENTNDDDMMKPVITSSQKGTLESLLSRNDAASRNRRKSMNGHVSVAADTVVSKKSLLAIFTRRKSKDLLNGLTPVVKTANSKNNTGVAPLMTLDSTDKTKTTTATSTTDAGDTEVWDPFESGLPAHLFEEVENQKATTSEKKQEQMNEPNKGDDTATSTPPPRREKRNSVRGSLGFGGSVLLERTQSKSPPRRCGSIDLSTSTKKDTLSLSDRNVDRRQKSSTNLSESAGQATKFPRRWRSSRDLSILKKNLTTGRPVNQKQKSVTDLSSRSTSTKSPRRRRSARDMLPLRDHPSENYSPKSNRQQNGSSRKSPRRRSLSHSEHALESRSWSGPQTRSSIEQPRGRRSISASAKLRSGNSGSAPQRRKSGSMSRPPRRPRSSSSMSSSASPKFRRKKSRTSSPNKPTKRASTRTACGNTTTREIVDANQGNMTVEPKARSSRDLKADDSMLPLNAPARASSCINLMGRPSDKRKVRREPAMDDDIDSEEEFVDSPSRPNSIRDILIKYGETNNESPARASPKIRIRSKAARGDNAPKGPRRSNSCVTRFENDSSVNISDLGGKRRPSTARPRRTSSVTSISESLQP